MVSACGLKLVIVSAPIPGWNTKVSLPGPPTEMDGDGLEERVAGGSVMSVPPFPSDAKLKVPSKLSKVRTRGMASVGHGE